MVVYLLNSSKDFLNFAVALDVSVRSLVQKGILAAPLPPVVNPPISQEDPLKKLISHIAFSFALTILFSVPALAQNTHSVWSNRPFLIKDGVTGAEFHPININPGDAIFAWTRSTTRAYAHAHGVINAGLNYDFTLISATGTTNDEIRGRWVVRRSGAIVCNNCIGRAYILSSPVGDTFKIYVGTPTVYAERWLYSGTITSRFDF